MEMKKVNSSAIKAIGYDPITKRMKIDFIDSGIYEYCNVPQKLFNNFLSSSSKGKFFYEYISERYRCPEYD